MRLVLYGLGKRFLQYQGFISWNDVVAVSDHNADKILSICPVQFVRPGDIQNIKYDYVVVFSDKYFDEIRFNLIINFFVVKDRIVPWRWLWGDLIRNDWAKGKGIHEFIRSIVCQNKIKSLLDVGTECIFPYVLTASALVDGGEISIDRVDRKHGNVPVSFYRKVYGNLDDVESLYDMAVVRVSQVALLPFLYSRCKLVVLLEDDLIIKEASTKKSDYFQHFGYVRKIINSFGIFWLITHNEQENSIKDIAIYVVTHKPHGLKLLPQYTQLCVGGYSQDGCKSETDGSNIAYLNPKINECTALYWIWKHAKTKYIGLCHYRRYFLNDKIFSVDNLLEIRQASKLLDEADILVPHSMPWDCTIKEGISRSVSSESFDAGYSIVRKHLAEKHTDDLSSFDAVMEGHNFYMCNMFVARKEIIDEYCAWLFHFYCLQRKKLILVDMMHIVGE